MQDEPEGARISQEDPGAPKGPWVTLGSLWFSWSLLFFEVSSFSSVTIVPIWLRSDNQKLRAYSTI